MKTLKKPLQLLDNQQSIRKKIQNSKTVYIYTINEFPTINLYNPLKTSNLYHFFNQNKMSKNDKTTPTYPATPFNPLPRVVGNNYKCLGEL